MSNTPKWLAAGALTIVFAAGVAAAVAAIATQRRDTSDQRVFAAAPQASQASQAPITELSPTSLPAATQPSTVAVPVTELAATEVPNPIPNELIDYPEFKRVVDAAEVERESKRLTETEFLTAMSEPGAVLLDVRSPAAFEQRHLRGAVNLPLTEWTVETLAQVIPAKDTKVLIYCNNNFRNIARTKIPPQALNLLSYTSLMAHGYTNIYELGPLLTIGTTTLPFEGTDVVIEVPSTEVPSTVG
jgi:phage shock protein E